jgi:thiosulfate/3-mercaptopyruvate sulfurtransferase
MPNSESTSINSSSLVSSPFVSSPLVSTQWLDTHLNDVNLKLIDASWYLPNMQRNGYLEFGQGHIAGALFFDIDLVCDQTSDLPHMAPTAEAFAEYLSAKGINDSHQLVVYDGAGLFSAARVWWLFQCMGLNNVSVLDGGLAKWLAEGRNTEQGMIEPQACDTPQCTPRAIMRNVEQVLQATQSKAYEIIDARAPGRFLGLEAEPREGLRSGHIPGSKNVFFKTLLNPDYTMQSPDDLRATFAAAGVDLNKPVITSCGSGITAAIINLALAQMGKSDHYLYDGSWAEWGMDPALPMATR